MHLKSSSFQSLFGLCVRRLIEPTALRGTLFVRALIVLYTFSLMAGGQRETRV